MVQTVGEDGGDVRSGILREATRLFAAKGYAGTSIQAIADAVGITKPTLVYHFGSKDGLRVAVLEGLIGHWREELPRLMAAATSGGPRLDRLLHALFAFFLRDRNRARLLVREFLDQPEAVSALLREHLQPWTSMLTEAIRVGQSQGSIRPDVHPEAYTQVVIHTAIGVIAVGQSAAALLSPEPDVDTQLAELVRMARVSLLQPEVS